MLEAEDQTYTYNYCNCYYYFLYFFETEQKGIMSTNPRSQRVWYSYKTSASAGQSYSTIHRHTHDGTSGEELFPRSDVNLPRGHPSNFFFYNFCYMNQRL